MYQLAYLNRDADVIQIDSVKTLCVGSDSCIALFPYIFHNWLHLKTAKACQLMPPHTSGMTGCMNELSDALYLRSQSESPIGCKVSHVRDGSSDAYRL